MADIKYNPVVKAYLTPTTLEDRTILQEVYLKIMEDTSHTPPTIYDEIYNLFVKAPVEDLNKPLVMTKPGLMPVKFTQPIQQGFHFAPKYHTHAKIQTWTAFNPIEYEIKISKTKTDRAQFKTAEHYQEAMRADAYAFQTALQQFRKLFVSLLFMEPDQIKKLESLKSDGTDGSMHEYIDLYFPTNGDTAGYPSHAGEFLEHIFMCWDENMTEPKLHSSENANNCKQHIVKVNNFKKIMEAIRKCLHANEDTSAKASDMAYATANGIGSEEYAKYVGWLDYVKQLVMEMKMIGSSKHNICIKAQTCATECEDLLKEGINIGCCKNCKDNKEKVCCCYNQTYAETSDLVLFMNCYDAIECLKGNPALNNTLTELKNFLGVGTLYAIPLVEAGKMFIWNKKTLGIIPVYTEYGSALYPEANDLHNVWIKVKKHITLWPFHAKKITKPS